MVKEGLEKILPVMQAFVEGKTIQRYDDKKDDWYDVSPNANIDFCYDYRIKPEQTYRSFKTQKECWEEMHKHSDFGFIRYEDSICAIQNIAPDGITVTDGIKTSNFYFEECFVNTKFIDGTPFGIKKE